MDMSAANTYELCMNFDLLGHVLRSSYNLLVLYSYSNSLFVREFGLINAHSFDIVPAISSGKVTEFFLSGEW